MKSKMVYSVHAGDLKTLEETATLIIRSFPKERIFTLQGDLGVGKTTLIKAFCRSLKVVDDVSSPTFSLINEHLTDGGKFVYHLDMYRIKDLQEAVDTGINEYMFSGSYCFIEWPEKIENLLPDNFVSLKILVDQNSDERTIIVRSSDQTK